MKHLGDITKINGATVPPVNVVIGGSPCQDLSVAGRREGLKGERSGLFMEQIRIIKEMRAKSEQNGTTDIKPRYMVWENVPGAFSSNKGADFKAVLEETIGVIEEIKPDIPIPKDGWHYSGVIMGDGFSAAWRVFDAQFWGVPQRRRRIALVADFGGTTAPEILFERKGVPGNPPQSGEQGQAPTGRTETGVGASSPAGLAYCIQGNAIGRADTAGCGGRGWRKGKSYTLNTVDRPAVAVFENHSQDTRFKGPVDVSQTVSSTFGMGGNNTPFVVNKETVASFKSKMGAKAGNIGYAEDLAPTLSATQIDASVIAPSGFSQAAYDKFNADDKTATLKAQGGSYGGGSETLIVDKEPQAVCMATQQGGAEIRTDNKAPTLTAAAGMSGNNQPVLCVRERCGCEGGGKGCLVQEDQSGALATNNDQFVCALDRAAFNHAQYNPEISESGINSTLTAKGASAVCNKSIVRRLTPLECERLQGFPDGWTDIGEYIDTNGKKRKTSDSARYKALGNSIALPPWLYVLSKLSLCCGEDHTMASLFDGIGGFPLIWETLNGEETCIWASEIEEFPIAVTKYHFNNHH